MTLASGCLKHHHDDGGFGADPSGDEVVLHAVHDVAQAAEADGHAVGLRENEGVIVLGLVNLVVAGQGVKQIAVFHAALGGIHVHLADEGAHILQAQAGGGELGGVDLDPDGGLLRAGDEDLADAFDLAEALADNFIRHFKDLGGQERVGSHGHDENRGVGRVDLAVGGRAGKVQMAVRWRQR